MLLNVILIAGLILLAIGMFLLFTTHHWFLTAIIKQPMVCSPADVLTTFLDPSRVLKSYFCHSA